MTVKGDSVTFGGGEVPVMTAASGVAAEAMGAANESTNSSVSNGSAGMLLIEESDFSAEFREGRWTVKWKWKHGEPQLKNQCGEYAVSAEDRAEYDLEIEQWIERGWLCPYDVYQHGTVTGVIPLMAVAQPNKQKVRPVLDYRELNEYVESSPGVEANVCGERPREWRKMGTSVALLDLSKAYLQLHVSHELHRFQAVRYRGVTYVLTRLGFGLAPAPKITPRSWERCFLFALM